MTATDALTAALAALDAAREVVAAVLEDPDVPHRDGGDPHELPLLLRFGEAAEASGLSRTAIFEKVRSGELSAVEVPGVGRRIRLVDLEAWVAALEPA